jgi:Tol biopolymer transport system component
LLLQKNAEAPSGHHREKEIHLPHYPVTSRLHPETFDRFAASSIRRLMLAFLMLAAGASLVSAQEDIDEYITHAELEWRTIETPHFFVHFHNGTDRTARTVAKIAEEIYGPVTSLYDHEPDQKVSLVIKDYDDYSNGGAYFYDNKIEIWAPALDFDLRGTHNWLRNVITHEFTHIVQIQCSMKFGRRVPGIYFQWLNYESERRQDVLYGYPNTIVSYPISGFVVPSWFAEGTAQYNRPEIGYDQWDTHRDMILRMYALDDKMLTWNEMGVFGKTSLGNESSYNAGFALVKYISETYGKDAVAKIARNLAKLDAMTIDGAIERALGKSGRELYQEWKSKVTADYRRRTDSIQMHLAEGNILGDVGIGNFYPAFSPDGKKIAYTSTKTRDYFLLSGLYVYDVEKNKETKIKDAVRSALSWSPDGNKIYYAKITHKNPYWCAWSDIYVYDIAAEHETRLTFAARSHNPSISPDGKKLAFAVGADGTMNVAVADSDGSNIRQLTHYKSGEQIFTPKWSPDGSALVFGMGLRESQDVMRLSLESGAVETLVGGEDDARNPVYSADGSKIVFSSDRTGIFNLYAYDLSSKKIQQISNVLGGAFMPSVNAKGDIAFSSYTSGGFKLALMHAPLAQDFSDASYLPAAVAKDSVTISGKFDWHKYRSYDDMDITVPASKVYKNVFTSLTIVPVVRIDNYNTKSKGLDFLKPGFYFSSRDVIDRLSMFGGAAMNRQWERDLFLMFEYRGRLLGLHKWGIAPVVSLEAYNITRKSSGDIELGLDRYSLGVTYGLLELDINFKQPLFSDLDVVTVGFSHSRYSADIGSFIIPSDSTHVALNVPGSSNLYFKGNDISVIWEFSAFLPSRNSEINPVGSRLWLRYDYEMNRFNSTGEYQASETGLSPVMTPFNFHKLELKLAEHFELPGWSHTLTLAGRGGTIFGPEVPDFFNFYAGGLIGMRGYPFYAIGGNEIAAFNATYRFPIWQNIDARLSNIYFDKIYGSFHADIGDAWNGTPALKQFKRDVGFELRLESYSFYAYPTRVFVNGTYGLDAFTYHGKNVTAQYGQEWRFYLGILFGFDLSDDWLSH